MNPYLAILKDSMREAFASRVLPFLLLMLTAALIFIVPLGLQQTSTEGKEGLRITYAGSSDWPLLDQLPQLISEDPKTVRVVVESFLATICMYLIGKFGVFVAILVSAGIIPRMLEPGSIDLLLSKPVSRPALFLTKFASGCAFILINVAYFMVGLWLIAGFRLGIWSGKLLLTIPVFLFVFSIIYSFSAVAGILWRNAIVSVMFAILLWLFCMGLGQFHEVMKLTRSADAAAVVLGAGDDVLMTERSGATRRWDAESGKWVEIFKEATSFRSSLGVQSQMLAFATPAIGPVYDPIHDRIAAVQMSFPTRTGEQSPVALAVGSRKGNWRAEFGMLPPGGTAAIFFDRPGNLLAVGPKGIYRSQGPLTVSEATGDAVRGTFERVGPEGNAAWSEPFAADLNRATGAIFVYDGGTLRKLEPSGDQYRQVGQRDLATRDPALVAAADSTLLVATEDGKVQAFDASTLEPVGSFSFADPQLAAVSYDGRWIALLSHRNRVTLFDAKERREVSVGVSGQGDITAIGWDTANRLLAADRVDRVTRYTVDDFRQDAQFSPPESRWGKAYRLFVHPLYTILPKPGDLDLLVQYLFTDERAEAMPAARHNLNSRRMVHDVWSPVWSNLTILAVILGLTSWYISRRDF